MSSRRLRLYYKSKFVPRGFAAITWPWGIHFRSEKSDVQVALLAHELVHVTQIKTEGVIRFYASYLWHFLKNLIQERNIRGAYLLIPYEIEARGLAKNFTSEATIILRSEING